MTEFCNHFSICFTDFSKHKTVCSEYTPPMTIYIHIIKWITPMQRADFIIRRSQGKTQNIIPKNVETSLKKGYIVKLLIVSHVGLSAIL